MRGLPGALRGPSTPLAVALALQLAALAALPRVVTVDGPGHVAGGWALAQLLLPDGSPVAQRLYEVDGSPVPNVLVTVLLAGLVPLLGADRGEQVLVAVHLLLLPLALRAGLRALDARAGWLAVLGVPFATGYLFLYGFYNFVLGVDLALLCVALALHRRHGWTAASATALAGLLLLTWSAHLLPALVAGVTCGLLAVARALAQRRAAPLLPVVAAGVPVLLLTLAFLADDAAGRGAPERAQPLALLTGLLGLRAPLVAYSPWEQVPAAALAVVLAAVGVRAVRRRAADAPDVAVDRRALALAAGLAVVAYAAVPQRFGPEYGFLDDRLSLFPPLLLLLAAAAPPPRRAALGALVSGTALACTVALVLLRLPWELHYQRGVADVLALAGEVPAGSVVVGLRLDRDPPPARNPYRDPLRHVVSRLAVEAGAVDAGHYEAALPYFPVRFRPAASPRDAVDPTGLGLGRVPTALDLSGAPVDAVVVLDRAPGRDADLSASGYARAAVSPRGTAALWLRR